MSNNDRGGGDTQGSRAADAGFERLVDLASEAIIVVTDGVVVFANPAAARLFRTPSPSDLVGMQALDLVDPAYRDEVGERLRRSVETAPAPLRTLQSRIRCLDGTACDVESTASGITFRGALSHVAFLRDVTARLERERALAEDERRYRAFTHATADSLAEYEVVDKDHVRCVWSGANVRGTPGLRPGDVNAPSAGPEAFGLEPSDEWLHVVAAITERKLYRGEFVRKIGSVRRWIRTTIFPLTLDPDEPYRYIVASRDVTDERMAEIRFAQLAHISQHLIYEYALHPDDSLTFRWVTDRATQLTGVHAGIRFTAEQTGYTWPDISKRGEIHSRLRAGQLCEYEIRWKLTDGSEAWFLIVDQPFGLEDDGESVRIVGSATDITARRRAEEDRKALESRLLHAMQLAERPSRVPPAAPRPASQRPVGPGSIAMRRVRELAEIAATHREPVIVTGETGTGKGHLARWIHDRQNPRGAPYVSMNCSMLRGELLISELFGATRGAYTSAARDRAGLVEEANGGTLFLDEIAELPPDAQAMVLKVLEEKSFRRLGETRMRQSDFRLVCATNRDLRREVAEGRFRRDLYYRINVFPIHMPNLAERLDELPDLVRDVCESLGTPDVAISSDAIALLARQRWPGNIRELRNALIRAILLARGGRIGPEHFPDLAEEIVSVPVREAAITTPVQARPKSREHPLVAQNEDELRSTLEALLSKHRGNRSRVAEELGISRTTLYRYLERAGLDDSNQK